MGKEQNKKKDSEKFQRKNSGLKIIIYLVVGILVLLAVIICIICGVKAYIQGEPIKMGDWLMAGCALLSMFGTVILACVSVIQSDRANKLNERLIKQNEELQKINDTQFKIVNQNMFPVLDLLPESLKNSDIEKIDENILISDTTKISLESEKFTCVLYNFLLDYRTDKAKNNFCICEFYIVNKGIVTVKNIKIYKMISSDKNGNVTNIYGRFRDGNWTVSDILLSGQKIACRVVIAYDEKNYKENHEKVTLYLLMEMETITGIKFYEKVAYNADLKKSYSQIEKITLEKIEA